jgi:anti-anti-sigma factor
MSTDASRLVIDHATARLALAGDLSEQEVQALRQQASAQLHPPVRRLVIDLAQCRFLDPVVVDLIGGVMGMADERGIAMTLDGASANVRVILGIAGLLDFPASRGDGAP